MSCLLGSDSVEYYFTNEERDCYKDFQLLKRLLTAILKQLAWALVSPASWRCLRNAV